MAALFGVLLLPRRATPPHDDIPLPIASSAALARAETMDRERAARAEHAPLPAPVRALGSALRAYHEVEAAGDPRELGRARAAVDAALPEALAGGDENLIVLRAVQLEGFAREIAKFESTGEESAELECLAGPFVRSMRTAGWCDGHVLAPRMTALRVMYKHMWDAFIGVEGRAAFDPSLDEERALYAFYLAHPHPSPGMRESLAAARRGLAGLDASRDDARCLALAEGERSAIEAWRIERIGRLAAIDPAYPADYARGIANFHRADYGAAARAFQTWLAAHPEGPLALRAANFLRAASAAQLGE